jgi:hypothetical protein
MEAASETVLLMKTQNTLRLAAKNDIKGANLNAKKIKLVRVCELEDLKSQEYCKILCCCVRFGK